MHNNKIILHACCAVCATYPIDLLKKEGYIPIVYFDNPNIYPFEEYEIRRAELVNYCKKYDIEYCQNKYENEVWDDFVKGLENEPEKGLRCDKCFQLRLEQTANKAIELGIKKFTTSIVISPHKNFSKIAEIASNIAIENNLDYLKIDFKKNDGFLKTNRISRELNLYRQNYCGCKFSLRK